jgi:hypothetical protein
VIALTLQLAAAGTTTVAGLLTLVVPIGLVIVMLGIWWVALRRGRTKTSEVTGSTPTAGEEPSALHEP